MPEPSQSSPGGAAKKGKQPPVEFPDDLFDRLPTA
jgi:hypothetical protein